MRFFRTIAAIVALFVDAALLTVGEHRTAEAAEVEKLNICYSVIAAASVSTWVPYEAGIYKKYGLDVNIIYVAGAQAINRLALTFVTHTD